MKQHDRYKKMKHHTVKRIENINSNEFIFYRADLKEGMYFYKITAAEKQIDVGRFFIE